MLCLPALVVSAGRGVALKSLTSIEGGYWELMGKALMVPRRRIEFPSLATDEVRSTESGGGADGLVRHGSIMRSQ